MGFLISNDNDLCITTGAASTITYEGVITPDDGYGGYNTKFKVGGSSVEYHIHFKTGSRKVTAINYKSSSSAAKGTSLYKDNEASKNLASLIKDCDIYPQHKELLTKLKDALPPM